MNEVLEYPCPECGYEGPHNPIDNSAIECGKCYASIDITDGEE
jgi:hypothetical protein